MGLSGKSKDIRYHRVDQSKNGEPGNSNFNFSIADDDDSDSELVNISSNYIMAVERKIVKWYINDNCCNIWFYSLKN
jgi:hypothetical protein